MSSGSTLSSQITSHRTFDFREPDCKANRRDLRVAPKMGGIGNQWHGWGRFRFVCSTPGKIGLLISIDLGSKSFKVYDFSGLAAVFQQQTHCIYIKKTHIHTYIYTYIYILCVCMYLYIYMWNIDVLYCPSMFPCSKLCMFNVWGLHHGHEPEKGLTASCVIQP